jgi:hypothetical protein
MSEMHPKLPIVLTEFDRKLLKKVRVLVRLSEDPYGHICPRISEVLESGEMEVPNDGTFLADYIRRSLAGDVTLEGWQNQHNFMVSRGRDHIADRLAWIDWILGEQDD